MTTQVVILAAGKGKRMKSPLPKVLHLLAGKPLLQHVLDKVSHVVKGVKPIAVVGHQGEVVKQALNNHGVQWVDQQEQLGTGHAVLQTLEFIDDQSQVLILYGDVPLIAAETLHTLLEQTPLFAVGMLTAVVDHPQGYGRIVRDDHQKVKAIVEEKDASSKERDIKEINSGIYCVPARLLKKWLPNLEKQNRQGEYYLTDIISNAITDKVPVHTFHPQNIEEIFGVNDCVQLATCERFYQKQYAQSLMENGVTIYDPTRLDIRGDVAFGQGVTLDINVILSGNIKLGDNVSIGAHCILKNVTVGNNTRIEPHSILEDCLVGEDNIIGPFARLRPGTRLSNAVHVGNFVEIKNSQLNAQTKVNHLSYIGDSQLGARVNVGAGTITCNYDGAHKHQTIIGDDVHIGSDTQLVAPVSVGDGATIAAGSTITKDVPPKALTLTHRLEQRSDEAWRRPTKATEDAS